MIGQRSWFVVVQWTISTTLVARNWSSGGYTYAAASWSQLAVMMPREYCLLGSCFLFAMLRDCTQSVKSTMIDSWFMIYSNILPMQNQNRFLLLHVHLEWEHNVFNITWHGWETRKDALIDQCHWHVYLLYLTWVIITAYCRGVGLLFSRFSCYTESSPLVLKSLTLYCGTWGQQKGPQLHNF